MTEKTGFSPNLWTPRSVAETRAIYADWADSYEADVIGAGYQTPGRIAEALADVADTTLPVLDFGCGTGLSGLALKHAGFEMLHGTDISPEMLAEAEAKGIYGKIWLSEPGDIGISPGTYGTIAAMGVVSLGAAPPETLAELLDLLSPGGLLALSYNDATLASTDYLEAMDHAISGPASLVSESYGPHLTGKNMGSKVYVLRKQ